jgi:hypothetical protein
MRAEIPESTTMIGIPFSAAFLTAGTRACF